MTLLILVLAVYWGWRVVSRQVAEQRVTRACLDRLNEAHQRGYIGRDLVTASERLRMRHQRVTRG